MPKIRLFEIIELTESQNVELYYVFDTFSYLSCCLGFVQTKDKGLLASYEQDGCVKCVQIIELLR